MSFNSVDDYIKSLNEIEIEKINEFIFFMKTNYPILVPKISFSMPMWLLGNKMYDGYVAISFAKKHYSIHFYEEDYILRLKKELPNCTFGKRCVNIKYNDEQSFLLVKQIIKDYIGKIMQL